MGWKFVPQPLRSEQFLNIDDPEQYPSLFFGLPAFNSRGYFQ